MPQEKHDKLTRSSGTAAVVELIRLAVEMGYPLVILFDNIDWENLTGIHKLMFAIAIGNKSKTNPARTSRKQLSLTLLTPSEDENAAAARARARRRPAIMRAALFDEERIEHYLQDPAASAREHAERRDQRGSRVLGRPRLASSVQQASIGVSARRAAEMRRVSAEKRAA